MNARNVRLDLLRIAAMLGIIILHILGVGGVTSNLSPSSINFWIAYVLELLTECSVNVFGIMSGYLLFGSHRKMKRIFELLTTVLLYSTLITVCFLIFAPGKITLADLITGILPMLRGRYWYITCYACMYIFLPCLNILVTNMTVKQCKGTLVSVVCLFSILPSLVAVDIFGLENGYSVAWLMVCYIIGACWRKADIQLFRRKEPFIILGSSALILLAKVCLFFLFHKNIDYMMSYVSPLVLLNAIMLVQLATRTGLKGVSSSRGADFISKTAKLTFDIYILHAHPLVFQYLMKGSFSWAAALNSWIMALMVLAIALMIFLICMPVAYLKSLIFGTKPVKAIFDRMGVWIDERINAE